MPLPDEQPDPVSNMCRSRRRGGTITWWGWIALLGFQSKLARALPLYRQSTSPAFAGLTPLHRASFDTHEFTGVAPMFDTLLMLQRRRGRRRFVSDKQKSKRLLSFALGASLDPDEEDDVMEKDAFNLMKDDGPSQKRRDLSDWLGAGEKSMVRPIRMEDGSIVDDDEPPKRMQTNFDKLFRGMPAMDDILGDGVAGDGDPLPGSPAKAPNSPSGDNARTSEEDDPWLEQKREEMGERYRLLLEEAVAELDQQRQEDPDSVPDSSYSMLKSMLKKEMEDELTSSKEQRSIDLLKEMEMQRLEELEAMDLTEVEDTTVEQIIQEATAEAERLDKIQAEMDSFNQYEEDAMRRVTEADVKPPQENADLDEWALDRMEEMLASQQNETTISENLEDSIDELRDRLDTRKDEPLIKPETMKEWQMYRSIATRLGKQKAESEADSDVDPTEDEQAIASQLQSWKEFQRKEEEYRRQSGLSSGVKMPFEWQEAGKDPMDDLKPPPPVEGDNRSPSEIRAELNQKALEAMQDLLQQGTIRSESLAQKIEDLKKDLESPVELTIEESTEAEKVEAVDLSDVFGSRSPPKQPPSPRSSTWIEETDLTAAPLDTPFFSSLDDSASSETTSSPAPPDTPFFSSSMEDDQLKTDSPPPPPDTPFFSADDEDAGVQTAEDSVEQEESKLGSLEEQKLRSMYQRAGARTASEQEELRMKWEEYQKYEKKSRDVSGLSDSSDLLNDTAVAYNMSDVLKDDGDIDAEKVLASIGPRPTRKSVADSTAPDALEDVPSTNITALEEDRENALKESDLDPDDVSDQLYRAVSAVGGGRTRDDPEAKAKEKADFEDYMRKEEEARQNLDVMDDEGVQGDPSLFENGDGKKGSMDDVEYAEKVLDSIGPRPERKPKREISSFERDYSDRGGALSEVEEDVEDEEAEIAQEGHEDDLLPDWFKKEQDETGSPSSPSTSRRSGGFLGSELFDDDEGDYEKNIRQAEEFGRRRRASSGRRQMGIDISDVLGRRGYDDYNEYAYDDYGSSTPGRDGSRSFSSFYSRKANLLEYTELNVKEINALMDHKDSPYATGVSQYARKINKPFREFGAIFRLEGTLVDVTGLQFEAWKKVAETFHFKPPELEDVRRAAVARPDVAVRKIFFWSDDLLVSRDAAVTHRNAMRDVFYQWMKDQSITAHSTQEEEAALTDDNSGNGNSESELIPSTGPPTGPTSEKELIEFQWQAWTKAAKKSNLESPSLDEVLVAKVISPADAVREAFHWTSDSARIDNIVKDYQQFLQELLGYPASVDTASTVTSGQGPDVAKTGMGTTRDASKESSPSTSPERPKTMLEIEFTAWTRTAEERGLETPYPEEAMVAMAINDPYVIVRDGFCWAEDPSEIEQLVGIYRRKMNELLQGQAGGSYIPPTKPTRTEKDTKEDAKQHGPTDQEILEMHVFSWSVAAEKHGFEPPLLEEMQLAMNLDPEDAIKRLFRWTEDEEVISKVSATYQQARRKISDKLIQKYNLSVDQSLPEKPLAKGADVANDKSPSSDELFQLSLDAWTDVAEFYGYSLPTTDEVLYAMTVGAEEAALNGFKWTSNTEKAREIALLYRDAVEDYSIKLKSTYNIDFRTPSPAAREDEKAPPFFSVVPGCAKWVKCLLDVEMPCAVVSYLDEEQVDVLLEQAGLANFFARDNRVSASSGYNRETQQLLGASLRLERRPDHCAVFDTSPESAVIAHDVEMKCVNMIGVYPMYDLLSADSTAKDFGDLTAMNLRRLFGDRVDDEPMLDMKQTQPNQGRMTKTRFWEEGDRS